MTVQDSSLRPFPTISQRSITLPIPDRRAYSSVNTTEPDTDGSGETSHSLCFNWPVVGSNGHATRVLYRYPPREEYATVMKAVSPLTAILKFLIESRSKSGISK